MNYISEPAMGHNLPKGLKLIPGYSPLSPGSCRVSAVVENGTDPDVTIPARTIVCQLGLDNRIPKLIYPGDDYDNDHDPEEMDDTDEGLTMVSTGTRNQGKPGKMGRHFPVREKSGNFVKMGKVREFCPKYWKNRKI